MSRGGTNGYAGIPWKMVDPAFKITAEAVAIAVEIEFWK